MKTKIFTTGLILLMVLNYRASAEFVGPEKAEVIARNYYWEVMNDLGTKFLSYEEIQPELLTPVSEGSTTLFYIFNINFYDGFILIAADDRVIPVLGYSPHGRWSGNDLPPALESLLNVFKRQILSVIEQNLPNEEEVVELWERYSKMNENPGKSTTVGPLLSTTWNQDTYYNSMCPADPAGPGEHTYAGCVAVAMAQVMKYWGYPTQGYGSHSYYLPRYGTISASFGTTTYSYNLMPNSLSSHNFHVAQLIYHCGVSVTMNYGPTGSVPMGPNWSEDILTALTYYFKFSSQPYWDAKLPDSSITDWINKLKSQLNSNYPLIYYGWDGGNNAHLFVCDGYRDYDDFFHFNWGWGGMYDGYYPVTNLTPCPGISYTTVQAAIMNLYPNQSTPVYFDYGDAPGNYPTLLQQNGARHALPTVPMIYLGYSVDREPNGQPYSLATGDDINVLYPGVDDEDGVTLPNHIYQGTYNTFIFRASTNGYLQGWIDFNQNGSWADPGEQVFTNQPLSAGLNNLQVMIPQSALLGITYARFRFSSSLNLSFVGPAPNGEVEDYFINIEPFTPMGLDFGDAPDSYKTYLSNDGARHVVNPQVFLGNLFDTENDGFPGPQANGDDNNFTDDEDGVIFLGPVYRGAGGKISVTASLTGFLNVWVDLDANGTFAEPYDHVMINQVVASGTNIFQLSIPPFAKNGYTYARFRYSLYPGLNYYGVASEGEVEDYRIFIYPERWVIVPTPVIHHVTLPVNLIPTINGQPIVVGDLIGAFYVDENGIERCAGSIDWNGSGNQIIVIYGDDPLISGKQGYFDGETIVWKIYSHTSMTSYNASASYDPGYANSNGVFVTNGQSSLLSLAGYTPQSQIISIPTGWCGLSSYLLPLKTNLDSIFAGFQNQLEIMQSLSGVYWPSMNINTIGNWDYKSGYKLKQKSSSSINLNINGIPLTDRTLNLSAGWHIIPVLSSSDVSTSSVLSSPSVILAKEIAGNKVYWPSMGINTLNVLKAGCAYMLKLSANTIINFTGKGGESIVPCTEPEFNSPWNKVKPTGSSYVIAIPDYKTAGFENGDLIGAFNESGLNVGIASFGESRNVLIVYGDDPLTPETDGMLEGERIFFKVYSVKSGKVTDILPVFNASVSSYDEYYSSEAYSSIETITGIHGLLFAPGIAIHPNPASEKIHIQLSEIPSENVHIGLYSMNGILIMSEVLHNTREKALDVRTLANGIYVIKITRDTVSETRKIVIQH